MSGILRNTLRLFTVQNSNSRYNSFDSGVNYQLKKFVQNNKLNSKEFYVIKSHSEPSLRQKLYASFSNKIIIQDETLFIADLDYFIASLGFGSIHFEVDGVKRKYSMFPELIVKVDEKLIVPLNTEIAEEESFNLKISNKHKVHFTRNDGKFTVTNVISGEAISFNHSVVIEKKKQIENNGEKKIPIIYIDKVQFEDTVVSIKNEKKEEKRTIQSRNKHGYEKAIKTNLFDESESDDLIHLSYDSRLFKFPMTASIKGGPQQIHMEKLGDIFSVYHKIDFQTYEVETDQKEGEKSKAGRVKLIFDSGNLRFQTTRFFGSCYTTKYEVSITIDFDGATPTLHLMEPVLKSWITPIE